MRSAASVSQRLCGVALFAGMWAGWAGAARADAIFQVGNNPQPDEENILLNSGATGTSIFGTTNQSGIDVLFSSIEELTAPSNGQARVEATD